MEFLKHELGEELYAQVSEKLKDSKIKLADLSSGAYVGKEKYDTELAKSKGLSEQLAAANRQIEEFRSMDIDSIKKAAEDWKSKAEQAEAKAKADIEAMQFDIALNGAIGAAKAKNTKAVKALLDMDGLKLNGGEIIGLKEQLAKVREENDYLFESDDPAPTFASPTGGGNPQSDEATIRAIMGLPPQK